MKSASGGVFQAGDKARAPFIRKNYQFKAAFWVVKEKKLTGR